MPNNDTAGAGGMAEAAAAGAASAAPIQTSARTQVRASIHPPAGTERLAEVGLSPPEWAAPPPDAALDAAAAAAGEAMELALLACAGRRPEGPLGPPARLPRGGRMIRVRHGGIGSGALERCAAVARSAWLQACAPGRARRLLQDRVVSDVLEGWPDGAAAAVQIALTPGCPEGMELRGRARAVMDALATGRGVSAWPDSGASTLMLLTQGGPPRALAVLEAPTAEPLAQAGLTARRMLKVMDRAHRGSDTLH